MRLIMNCVCAYPDFLLWIWVNWMLKYTQNTCKDSVISGKHSFLLNSLLFLIPGDNKTDICLMFFHEGWWTSVKSYRRWAVAPEGCAAPVHEDESDTHIRIHSPHAPPEIWSTTTTSAADNHRTDSLCPRAWEHTPHSLISSRHYCRRTTSE